MSAITEAALSMMHGAASTLQDRLQLIIEQLDRIDLVNQTPGRDTLRQWLRQLDEAQELAEDLVGELAAQLDEAEKRHPCGTGKVVPLSPGR